MNIPSGSQNQYVNLFIGYGISFAFIALSYVAYSRLLSPTEFGLYAIALAIGSFGAFLLDGGLKTAIIKHSGDLSEQDKGVLLSGLVLVSISLSVLMILLEGPFAYFKPALKSDFRFLSLFTIIYLMTYPFVAISTASLERKLEYKRIAWVESGSIVIERAAPALFLVFTETGMYAFVWGLALGRLFRLVFINRSSPVIPKVPSIRRIRSIVPIIKEGSWIQLATGCSLLRDNIHILLLGPIYGKDWVGYYSWGLQLCLVLSQAFVQVSARVSLPLMAQRGTFEQRWGICRSQIRFLSIFTTPLMVVSLLVLPGIDIRFFHGKWEPTIRILPLLFLRMVAGLATTPISNLTQVERGGFFFARAMAIWTAVEYAGAGFFLYALGPGGLACSYAIMVWAGLWAFLKSLPKPVGPLFREVLASAVCRPSLLAAASTVCLVTFFGVPRGAAYQNLKFTVPLALLIVAFSYLTEREVRERIGSGGFFG